MTTLFGYLYVLLFVINILVLVSSVDDAFVDAYFWIRAGFRKLTICHRHPKFDLARVHTRAEAPFAILVPAWKEFSVIARMLETAQAGLEYQDYMIFVGTYANDRETQAEVDRIARRYRKVRRVEVPHAGPTCKADCLNWILRAVLEEEGALGRPFAGFVLHDAEDVIHPLELKAFNFFIDRRDLIQLPVLSLEQDKTQWVGGTYQDDFAEWHSKDMVVRESITGLVPCAGTGVCYSHRAMAALCAQDGQAPFNTSSLTEDYDISIRLKRLGMRQMFLQLPLSYRSSVRAWSGRKSVERFSFLGVRENFPASFRKAFRQRSRWILGISLQGWEAFGWEGDFWSRYFMFRDRKGLFTSLINIVAYALFMGLLGLRFSGGSLAGFPDHPFAGRFDGMLILTMEINGIFMINRVVQRYLFVSRFYGWLHGLLAIPRIFVNNAINFAAAVRAWRLFIAHRITRTPLAWDKTAHVFPTHAELGPFNRRLGEILLEWRLMDEAMLAAALREQETSGLALGQILLQWNWVSEEALADAIACQAKLPRSRLDLKQLEETQSLAPRPLLLRFGLVPLGLGEDEEVLLGSAIPPSGAMLETLSRHLTRPPRFFILCATDLAQGLAFLALGGRTTQVLDPRACRLLEDYLVKHTLASRSQALGADYCLPEEPERFLVFLAEQAMGPVSVPRPMPTSDTLVAVEGS